MTFPRVSILLFNALALLFVGQGCVTHNTYQLPASGMPVALFGPAAGITLISAVYGSGTGFADVSERVAVLLQLNRSGFRALPHEVLADPTPGWNKALVITYELDGKRHVFITGEGGQASAELLRAHAKGKD